MSVIHRINSAIEKVYSRTGIRPNVLYIGKKERQELSIYLSALPIKEAEPNSKNQLLGCAMYYVDDDNHIGTGISVE